ALGEATAKQKLIETVPKCGYRFLGAVRRVASGDESLVIERHTRSRVIVEESEFGPEIRSIAVLPFSPLNYETRDEYLELGIADALITRLSNISQIIVRPTSTVRKYLDLARQPSEAGHELRVRHVLDGSIQKNADRIRVTAQLVSVDQGRCLWAGTFDEMFTDIFAVEDAISAQVARALTQRLTGEEERLIGRHYTENPEAHRLYLRGRYHWNKRTRDGYERGIEHFGQ